MTMLPEEQARVKIDKQLTGGDSTRNFYGQSPFGSKKVSEDNGI